MRGSPLLGIPMLVGFSHAAMSFSKTSTAAPCTATSLAGSFYDLRADTAAKPPTDGSKPSIKGQPTTDYHVRGWDYGSNFTMNLCDAVVEPIDSAVGINSKQAQNVSAYYVQGGEKYSLGQQSSQLTSRGKKVVLQYINGSPCGKTNSKRDNNKRDNNHLNHNKVGGRNPDGFNLYDTEESSTSSKPPSSTSETPATAQTLRTKSATISFLCDRDPAASSAAVSFVATDPEECAYFFEVRSPNACAGVEPHKPGSVGPGSVFAIILLIAVLVYLGGGIMYQRTVANMRGWRQLPNYSLWAGIWGFFSNLFLSLTTSCARLMPSRRGYQHVSGSPSYSRRSRDREAENRLIDQLDEEWDD